MHDEIRGLLVVVWIVVSVATHRGLRGWRARRRAAGSGNEPCGGSG
jgi:hypothetical protein